MPTLGALIYIIFFTWKKTIITILYADYINPFLTQQLVPV